MAVKTVFSLRNLLLSQFAHLVKILTQGNKGTQSPTSQEDPGFLAFLNGQEGLCWYSFLTVVYKLTCLKFVQYGAWGKKKRKKDKNDKRSKIIISDWSVCAYMPYKL